MIPSVILVSKFARGLISGDVMNFETTTLEGANVKEYTVSELSLALKRRIEEAFGFVRVRGEISGLRRVASGHSYLALKDEAAVLDAVIWKGVAQSLGFAPEEGMEVVCTGRLSTYPGRSKYQLIIETIALAGVGALLKLLEERRQRLAAEGLFAEERKKKLPYLPRVIGVVTSPSGAVIRDILHRLADRFPRPVLLWPVAVQGEGAADEIAAAIRGFNRLPEEGVPRPDLIIVARGGGSLEDLMAFNEEIVVRAAASSAIPLISSIGHETDWTLIDYASDRRAPTPTAAAEMAVPVRLDLLAEIESRAARLVSSLSRLLQERRVLLSGLARGLPLPRDLFGPAVQRLDDRGERLRLAFRGILSVLWQRLAAARLRPEALGVEIARLAERSGENEKRLALAFAHLLERPRQRLENFGNRLETHAERHESLLERGYVVVRDGLGVIVTRAKAVLPGMALELEFHDGKVDALAAKKKGGRAPKKELPPEEGRLL